MNGRRGWRLAVPLVLVLAGLLAAAGAYTARGDYLRSARQTDLADLIRAQENEAAALSARVAQLRTQVDRLTATQGAGDARVAAARASGQALAPAVGLTVMVGPGVIVTLDDAPTAGSHAVPAGVTPDDLVVHQQDVQAVVNALWAGGAQGVAVMGQRLLSTAAVRCVGNVLLLYGRVYSPPYAVSAVGDVAGMRGALQTSPGLVDYRQWVQAVGLGYRVTERADLALAAYGGALDLTHAHAS